MKPKKLYIAAKFICISEKETINEQVVKDITWQCDYFTLFDDQNFCNNLTMSWAINWFFDNETEGIVLKNDCLPSDSFFGFCSNLLEKYRNDERIGHINGYNLQKDIIQGDGSYYFSTVMNTLGWAGWKRVWKDFDLDMKPHLIYKNLKRIVQMSALAHFKNYWNYKYNLYLKGIADIWELQYSYIQMMNNRLSVVPNSNLIVNIGCNGNETFPFSDIPFGELSHIVHPSYMVANIDADIHLIDFELNTKLSNFYEKDFLFIKNKLMSFVSEQGKFMKIPKIIHQIYFDMNGVPDNLSVISKTWKEKHPDWEHRFWNQKCVEQFLDSHFPESVLLYHSFAMDVQRWDFVRYLILYCFGGLYVDMDYECLEPLDALLWNSSCCMGLEPESHAIYSNKPFILGNALMAVVPKHEFFHCIIKEIISGGGQEHKHKGSLVLESTGSFMLNRVYDAYEKKDDIILLPAELVAPLEMEECQKIIAGDITKDIEYKVEKAFAIHYYFNSWLPQTY